MKKITNIMMILAAILAFGCSNTTETKAQEEKAVKAVGSNAIVEGKPIDLNRDMFIERVMDYVTNKDEWVYKGDKPAIIDFWADWCKPCKLIAPIMEELAAEYEGKIYVYKVDTQVERELAAVFGIRSIPAVLYIPMEGKPQMSTGALPKETFKGAIDEFLLKPLEGQQK
jgi:thioredoxin